LGDILFYFEGILSTAQLKVQSQNLPSLVRQNRLIQKIKDLGHEVRSVSSAKYVLLGQRRPVSPRSSV